MNVHIGELERKTLARAKAIRLRLMGKPEKKAPILALTEPKKAEPIAIKPVIQELTPQAAPIEKITISMSDASGKPLFAADYIKKRCAEVGLDYAEIMGRSRSVEYSRPRQMIMVEVRDLYGKSLPEIGRLFNRDHTTVLHALQNVEKYRLEDGSFDMRPKWRRMLDDHALISEIKDMYFANENIAKIREHFSMGAETLDKIINHFKWSRPFWDVLPKKEPRVYPVDEMQQDYFSGMSMKLIAQKYKACPARVARFRDDMGWVRDIPAFEPKPENPLIERNRKMRILYETGMSCVIIGVRFHIRSRQVQALARQYGWKRKDF